MKYVAIISARLGSSRFPKKVLQSLWENKTVLEILTKRLSFSKKIYHIIVATTDSEEDKELTQYCNNRNINSCKEGKPEDNIKSIVEAYKKFEDTFLGQTNRIIDITADCPFIDPFLIDEMINLYEDYDYDYFSNVVTRSFPIGFDVQIYKPFLLFNIDRIVRNPLHRKHSGWNIINYWTELVEINPEIKMGNYSAKDKYFQPDWRLAIDYPEDLLLLQTIISGLHKIDFRYNEVIDLILRCPYLLDINKNCRQKIAGKDS